MKKLFLLSVVALLSVSLLAQEKKMVEFAKTVYDFGTVAEGSTDFVRLHYSQGRPYQTDSTG